MGYKKHHIFLSTKISKPGMENVPDGAKTPDFRISSLLRSFILSKNNRGPHRNRYTVFLSETSIKKGAPYLQEVDKNMDEATVFVLVCTHHDFINASENVINEISKYNSLRENKRKDPNSFKVFFSDKVNVDRIDSRVKASITAINYNDRFKLSNYDTINEAELTASFEKLYQSISTTGYIL